MIYIAFVLLLQIVELDLSTVAPSVSGPKRPHDRVSVSVMKQDFTDCLNNKVGFKGFGIPPEKQSTEVPFIFDGQQFKLAHGKNSYLSLNLSDIYVYYIIIIIVILLGLILSKILLSLPLLLLSLLLSVTVKVVFQLLSKEVFNAKPFHYQLH